MASPYSVDFRAKVIEIYKTKNITQQELAGMLAISISTVKRYLRLDRAQLSLLPKKQGKGRPNKINEQGYELIESIINDKPNITLKELSQIYFKKLHVNVGKSILSRACQQLKLTRKKLSLRPAELNTDENKKKEKNILRK